MTAITGITRDNSGNIAPSCDVFLLKYASGTHLFTQVAHVVSDPTTGVFTFSGIADSDPSYNIVAFKDGTPHIFDVSDRNVQPFLVGGWTSPASSANLQWWFDASAANSCYTDAGTTPCTDTTRVYRFKDLSGHNYHLEQTTGSIRPSFQTADTINGHQAMRIAEADGLGGAAQYMQMTGSPATITGNCITFMVFQPLVITENTPGLWADQRIIHIQRHIALGNVAIAYNLTAGSEVRSTILPTTSGQPYASYVKSSPTVTAIKVTGDSAEVSSNLSSGDNGSSFVLGPWELPTPSTPTWLNALIGELFCIAPYTQADVDGATAYLTAKWSVAP